jgi:hypothetical protein
MYWKISNELYEDITKGADRMKIYVVESMCHGECEGVEAVFSSQEKAEAFVEKTERNNPHGNAYPITEMTLDVPR